jgi:hypothetical protein
MIFFSENPALARLNFGQNHLLKNARAENLFTSKKIPIFVFSFLAI